ncbi:MAG: hypothetical protein E6J14_10040 [Chloroflexi bacterium]|nr:MAG: hypothetical protein E6J14_10040 [Chloroflexota bacterium]
MRRPSNRSRGASEVLLDNGFDSTTAGRRRTRRGSRDPWARSTDQNPNRHLSQGRSSESDPASTPGSTAFSRSRRMRAISSAGWRSPPRRHAFC